MCGGHDAWFETFLNFAEVHDAWNYSKFWQGVHKNTIHNHVKFGEELSVDFLKLEVTPNVKIFHLQNSLNLHNFTKCDLIP